MTRDAILAWLAARTPDRPAALAAQMARSVAECSVDALAAVDSMAEAMGVLGVATLVSVTAKNPDAPRLALELLAADAFVTYAFEAAADASDDVSPLALQLLRAVA